MSFNYNDQYFTSHTFQFNHMIHKIKEMQNSTSHKPVDAFLPQKPIQACHALCNPHEVQLLKGTPHPPLELIYHQP